MEPTESYTPGYSGNASQFMAKRRAETHAAFPLPYLQPGFDLLDCGCGPGTITAGLATAVAPGRVVGIDLGESQIALATTRAAEQGLRNTEFKVGNIYELSFDGGTFDAIFAHAVFEHLSDPIRALREAGFARIKVTASYECYENRQAIAEYMALRLEAAPAVDGAAKLGGVDNTQIAEMVAALRTWSKHPDSLFAQA